MTIDAEQAMREFEQSYRALLSYRYFGKGNTHIDKGVERELMPLRRDMRNSTGGIMASPLCIAAIEPWWLDYQGIAAMVAPVTMTYSVIDPAYDVGQIEVLREVISVGRTMGFSRAVVVDAQDHGRVIAISTGSGFDLGVVPDGFKPIDNPVHHFDDDADLPPLREAFGVRTDHDGTMVIDELTAELGAPNKALHQGPINILAEAAAIDALERSQGTIDFQVDHWTVQFIKPGDVGPFRASATVRAARGGRRCGVDVTLVDEGRGARTIATVSALFSRVDR
jgi:acyl-coenzyme A thioesterase PaaI-like protein